ncbi:MAG: transposase [Synergistaceae bacterium]|nr:transposase [Synergistaceae bacterium]
MTEDERLAKNERIREAGRATKLRRKEQICRVWRVKIDFSHLNSQQQNAIKMLFVEAKRLHNDIITFMKKHDINEYDYKTQIVHNLDKDKNPVTHTLEYISSQMKQTVIQSVKDSMKALKAAKTNGRKVGALKYKSDYQSINLQQHGKTYSFYSAGYIKIQKLGKIRIRGAGQFFNIPNIEFANAKLLKLPDGYYIDITTYQDKGVEQKEYKSEVGIDMGIKTTITTSDGIKYNVSVEESERLKKCQRLAARRVKGSSNWFKAVQLLRKEYQKLDNRKNDAANKIVHELLQHERVYMQNENLKGWHKGLFGRKVQHSILGRVKAKLLKSERVIVLPSSTPTTKYCPCCGKLKKDITLADRVYQCDCGYHEDRDIHAARNMIFFSKRNTCGTQ